MSLSIINQTNNWETLLAASTGYYWSPSLVTKLKCSKPVLSVPTYAESEFGTHIFGPQKLPIRDTNHQGLDTDSKRQAAFGSILPGERY